MAIRTPQDLYEALVSAKKTRIIYNPLDSEWYSAEDLYGVKGGFDITPERAKELLRGYFDQRADVAIPDGRVGAEKMFNEEVCLCVSRKYKKPYIAIHKNKLGELGLEKKAATKSAIKYRSPEDMLLSHWLAQNGYDAHLGRTRRGDIFQALNKDDYYVGMEELAAISIEILPDKKQAIVLTKSGQEKMSKILDELGIKKKGESGRRGRKRESDLVEHRRAR